MQFTRELFNKLQRQYKQAIAAGQTEFTFEGQTLLVSYAKYLIEYLSTRFQS